jgi:hypothetical protein
MDESTANTAISANQGTKRGFSIKNLKSKISNNRLFLICSLVIFLIALAARVIPGPRTIDDSYITFRYARNILAGNGFAYNPGEHVLGTTTPLYTLLLASLAAFSGGDDAPFPLIALLVNALADSVTCLLLIDLGRRLGSIRAGLGAALVWAIAPFSVTFAIGGLETSVYVLLLTATVHAHLRTRRIQAALCAALALLTRPDALILLGPLVLDRLWQLWRQGSRGAATKSIAREQESGGIPNLPNYQSTNSPIPLSPTPLLKELLAFALPTLAWIIFAAATFGSPIPHSIAAKSLAYRLPADAAFIRLLQHYTTPFLGHLTFGIAWIGIGMLLYPFLFLVGVRRAWRANPHAWPFLAYPWLYFAAFSLANPLIFRWYLTPPLPAYILAILIGLDQVLGSIWGSNSRKRLTHPAPPFPVKEAGTGGLGFPRIQIVFFILLAPALLSLRGWVAHTDHGLSRPTPEMAWYQLELLYRQAADTLIPRLGPDPSANVLAAGDVGVLGFFTKAKILDTVGLNTPQSLPYYPLEPDLYTINYAIPPDLILDHMPDYIVILEVYGRAGLLKEPGFWDSYELLQKIPTDIYGSDGMLILEKKKLASSGP